MAFISIKYSMNNGFADNLESIKHNTTLVKDLAVSIEEHINSKEHDRSVASLGNYSDPLTLGIIKTDSRGIIQEVSYGIERLTEKGSDELVGVSISTLMSKRDWEEHKVVLSKTVEKGVCSHLISFLPERKIDVEVNYCPTENIFIINMREI
jgi:PAS domain S-box-containing protein